MKIRDSHATINGDDTQYEMPSGGCDIIADDGKTLLSFCLQDGGIRIHAGQVTRHGGKILDDCLLVKPHASNCIIIIRPEYK
jgi:hypothetical protein